MNIVGQFLQRSAQRFPDKVALIDGKVRFTYAQLLDAARRVAAGMQRHGLRPGDRVAYHGNNRWELVVTMFAAFHGGFVLSPLNVMLKPAELDYILKLSGIRLILTTQEGEPSIQALGDSPAFQTSSYDDPAGLFAQWMAEPAEPQEVARRPDDVVALFFTSGTTGNPKGAPIDQEFVDHLAHSWVVAARYTSNDVCLVLTPMFWAAAPIHGIMPVVLVGGTIVLLTRFDVDKCCALIEEHRVSCFFAVPTIYTMLTDKKADALRRITSLRVCGVGGSPLTPEAATTFEQMTGARLLNTYGSTEAGAIAREMIDVPRRLGCVGTPGGTVEMKIVDSHGQPVPAGVPGEIHARGLTAIKGYWKDGRVDPSMLVDGWLNTGDVGVIEDGYVRILDRTKDMIITGGANIYSAEVERVIALHPQIQANALIGVSDRVMGEFAVAYVVAHAGQRPTENELSAFCRERLSSYKVPRRFVFVDSLPMTSTGKVQKVVLRELAQQSGLEITAGSQQSGKRTA